MEDLNTVKDFAPVRKPNHNVFNQIFAGFCDPNKEDDKSDDDDGSAVQHQERSRHESHDTSSISRSVVPTKKDEKDNEKRVSWNRQIGSIPPEKKTGSLKPTKMTNKLITKEASAEHKDWKPLTNPKTTALLVCVAMVLGAVLVLTILYAIVFVPSDSSISESAEIILGALSTAKKSLMENLEWAQSFSFMAIGNAIMSKIHLPTPVSATDVNGLDFPFTVGDQLNLVGGGMYGNVMVYSAAIYLNDKGLKQVQNERYNALDASFFNDLINSNNSMPKGLVLKFHRKVERKGFEKALLKNMRAQLPPDTKDSYDKFSSTLASLLPSIDIPKGAEFSFVCSKKNTITASSGEGRFTIKDKNVCPAFFGIYLGQSVSARSIKNGFLRAALAKT